MQPTVSILLPVYNGEQYVRQAIKSVLEQSFCDWELIIQDDCSTDKTVSLVNEFSDPRVFVSCNEHNLHIAGNLNAALSRARGRFIQLLAQDDRLLPNCLATQVKFMESHPEIGFSFCTPFLINETGERLVNGSHAWDAQYRDTPEICESYLGILLLFNYGCLPGSISTVIIRRHCLEQIGGFDTTYRICLDWDLWIRLARTSGFGFVKKRLTEIREHAKQESRNPSRVRDRIVETYRCLDLLQKSLPVKLTRALCYGRKKRYGVEFMHQTIQTLLAGHLQQGLDYFRVVQSKDGFLIPFVLWAKDLPKRALRRILGGGSIELRAAFKSEWLRKQVARGRLRV